MTSSTDSKDPHSDSNIPSSQPLSMQQLGFMGALPSDILLAIFSHINQAECLTCMAVCRDWYYAVPQYAQSVWTTVHFRSSDSITENMRQIRCLGDHVKNVTLERFKEHDLYYAMHLIVEWGCTKIRSLELSECSSPVDQDVFLAVLKKLAPHLTQLKIVQHYSNVAFLHVLDVCPRITHFTFTPNVRTRWRESIHDQDPFVEAKPSTRQFTSIIYLCLDIVLDKKMRLDPILKRCPNLRWFIGASTDKQHVHSKIPFLSVTIDLETMLDWCPKLVCFQDNLSYNIHKDKFEYIDTVGDGIRYLSQCQDFGREQVALNLWKFRRTLEYFSLRVSRNYQDEVDWSPVFRTLQLPKLRTLYLNDSLHFDVDSIFRMLNHSPLMETLVLGCHHLNLDIPAIGSLQMMPCLRYLECHNAHTLKDDVLLSLLDRLPALEHLVIHGSNMSLSTLPYTQHQYPTQLKRLELTNITFNYAAEESIAINENAVEQFIQYFATHSELETIDLSNVSFIGAKALQAIASIRTLKTCQIELDEALPLNDTQAGLLSFVIMLKQTRIERLHISRLQCVSFDVFDAIGDLPLLLELSIPEEPLFSQTGITRVSGLGLIHMLRKSSSLRNIALENVFVVHPQQVAYYDNLSMLLKQEMPFYAVSGSPQEKDFPTEETFMYELFVKRRYK